MHLPYGILIALYDLGYCVHGGKLWEAPQAGMGIPHCKGIQLGGSNLYSGGDVV